MIIGICEITLHLPDCHSLKEKRQIIKPLIERARHHFEIAIAEVGENDRWQIAKIGISCVSNTNQHANEILAEVQRYIEKVRPDLPVSNIETELINW